MENLKQTLIKLFELEKMEPEKGKEFLERLARLVLEKVLMQELPMLSEADLEKYDEIVAKNKGPEILLNFLKEKVPNFENLLLEEAESLHVELGTEKKNL